MTNKPKPILFNTEMVQAISNGYKLATRRRIDQEKYLGILQTPSRRRHPEIPDEYYIKKLIKPRYAPGDILYVRETWAFQNCIDCMDSYMDDDTCMLGYTPVVHEDKDSVSEGCYIYRADCTHPERYVWHPSIHMPRTAARIWLEILGVKIQRLQDMTLDDFLREGVVIPPEAYNDPDNAYMQARNEFIRIWDFTVPQSEISKYAWAANPWIWAYDFKWIPKPKQCVLAGIHPAEDHCPCRGYQKSTNNDEPAGMCEKCEVWQGEKPEAQDV